MLYVVGRDQDFASFGPLADSWWVLLVLGSVGLAFALDAIGRSARTLKRFGRAMGHGYRPQTIARVLADAGRDMGFLSSGSRHFSMVDAREREAIAAMRVAAWLLLTFGGLWSIFSLSVGLFAAARGALSVVGLQLVALGPALLAYTCGMVAMLVQDSRVRRARTLWHRQPWASDLAAEEIRSWQRSAGLVVSDVSVGAGRAVARSGLVVGAVALLVALPVLTLVPATAVGPILTAIAAPNAGKVRPRAARAEAYRSYRVEGDVSISPTEAGQILHDLLFVGVDEDPSPRERAPSRRVPESWLPDGADGQNPMGIPPFAWGDSLFERLGQGTTADQRTYLADLAGHPAASDFSRLARATAVDVGSARWDLPFAPGVTVATIPIPRFGPLRNAAYARIGSAGAAFLAGRNSEAEQMLREVVSVGFLLADDGPTLIDNLIGLVLVESGGSALADFYRTSGQPGAAAEISRVRQAAEAGAALIPTEPTFGNDAWVRSLTETITDPRIARGLRWEYFVSLATLGPCLNVNRIVFGMGDDYAAFVEEARESLVRWPSDQALFDIAKRGWLGASDAAPPTMFGRIAGLYMRSDENSCGQYVRHMQAGDVFK
jgi:hypothetical protein